MALSVHYDSTFDGFMSAVFEIYRQHLDVGDIVPDREGSEPLDLFLQPFTVETNFDSSSRLCRAVVNYSSEEVLNLLNAALLSEERGVEMLIFAFLQKLFSLKDPRYGKNPASEEMLPLYKIAQAVRREAGGMLGILRFAVGPDGVLYSEIEPKYDILLLMQAHFCKRFSNERWLIFDSKRKYGLYYDGYKPKVVYLPNYKTGSMDFTDDFTAMWKDFYDSIAIKERENPRLLRRCLPVRYWKHLPERVAS